MAQSPSESPGRVVVPPRQHNFDEAAARALIAARKQPTEQLEWLGAVRSGKDFILPVLGETLTVEMDSGTVRDTAGRAVSPWWRILTLHYLAVSTRPESQEPTVAFADLPGGRAYASVYQQRVIERLCRTVGRDGQALARAAEALGGRVLKNAPGDLAVAFAVYPRLRVHLVWYAGAEELPPSATLLLPANVEAFLGVEDIVVLSERLVAHLAGSRF
jgi:hypothetical protein